GTYPLADIPRLAADIPTFDMVIGARTGELVRIPFLRRLGKWILTQLAEYLSRQRIPDLNSGFRIFRKDVAMRFFAMYPDGFSFTTTITLRSEEHTSELQSLRHLVCRLLLEKKK